MIGIIERYGIRNEVIFEDADSLPPSDNEDRRLSLKTWQRPSLREGTSAKSFHKARCSTGFRCILNCFLKLRRYLTDIHNMDSICFGSAFFKLCRNTTPALLVPQFPAGYISGQVCFTFQFHIKNLLD